MSEAVLPEGTQYRASVYRAFHADMPFLAVILDHEDNVVTSAPVPSVAAGESLLKEIMERFAADKAEGRI